MGEIINIWNEFDNYTKKIVGQLFYEEIKNGKILKEPNKRKTDRSYFNTLRKQEEC